MLDDLYVAAKCTRYTRFVTELVKVGLQLRCVQVMHFGLLHGFSSEGSFFSAGNFPVAV